MNLHVVTVTSKENAELVETADGAELKSGEIRGRTICSLISPGTELAWNYCGEKFPTCPGYSAVFRADEVGSDVKDFKKGDIVFCMGGHRSVQRCESVKAMRVPDSLAPEKAVLARLIGVSMTTLVTTAARPGDIVVVSGAGPVGYLAAQIFNLSGYDVRVVEPLCARREMVEKAGIPALAEMPHGEDSLRGKIALVVECSGHEQAVLGACMAVRRRGEVVLVGVPWRRFTELHAHELLHAVFHNYVVLRSGWEWELPHHSSNFQPHSIFSGYGTALRWLSEGRLRLDGLAELLDPRNPQKAYQDLLNRRAKGLFQIFDWRRIA